MMRPVKCDCPLLTADSSAIRLNEYDDEIRVHSITTEEINVSTCTFIVCEKTACLRGCAIEKSCQARKDKLIKEVKRDRD